MSNKLDSDSDFATNLLDDSQGHFSASSLSGDDQEVQVDTNESKSNSNDDEEKSNIIVDFKLIATFFHVFIS